MLAYRLLAFGLGLGVCAMGCSSGGATSSTGSASQSASSSGNGSSGDTTSSTSSATASAGTGTGSGGAGGKGGAGGTGSTGTTSSTGSAGGAGGGPMYVDTLDSNRDRLLATYFAFLKANATQPQSNGLSSSNVSSVCDVWSKLDPSSQAVYLTITERLQASKLGVDGSSMLWHVTKIYRITGGQGATQADPGSCGGGEFNRLIMSMDDALHTAQVAANSHQGAAQGNGKFDISDAPPQGTFWRDSHDLGGPHAPFDLSDETDQGAPRGQTQYFNDPSSALANTALGRQDLMTLVDPYALEMDQDYDCVHSSNPLCSYITYGAFCLPQPSKLGTELCAAAYGDYEPSWKPTGCP
jgi:hypothetical protein